MRRKRLLLLLRHLRRLQETRPAVEKNDPCLADLVRADATGEVGGEAPHAPPPTPREPPIYHFPHFPSHERNKFPPSSVARSFRNAHSFHYSLSSPRRSPRYFSAPPNIRTHLTPVPGPGGRAGGLGASVGYKSAPRPPDTMLTSKASQGRPHTSPGTTRPTPAGPEIPA